LGEEQEKGTRKGVRKMVRKRRMEEGKGGVKEEMWKE
jgi:hypothetical protein